MLDNQFDQFFRDRLLNHSSKVQHSTWTKIHGQWARHRPLSFWKWYISGPVAAIVLLTAAHFIFTPAKKPLNPTARSSATSTTQASADVSPATRPAASPSTAVTPSGAPSSSATPSGAPPSTATSSSAKSWSATPSSALTTSSARARGLHHSTRGLPPSRHATWRSSGYAAHIAAHHRNHATADNHTHATFKDDSGTVAGHSAQLSPGRTIDKIPGRPAKITPASNEINDLTNTSTSTPVAGAANAPKHLQTKQTIVRLSAAPAITLNAPKRADKLTTPPALPTPRERHWQLDAFASPDFPSKQFAFSSTAGARITMPIGKHWSATAGVQFSKVNAHEITNYGLYPGHFNNVDLPVLLGYTVESSRFIFTVHAGAIFNLYSQAHGELTDYPWPNRRGVSAYLGAEFSKDLSDRFSIFAEPYGRCLFSNKNTLYPAAIFTEGVLLGIRYNFGK